MESNSFRGTGVLRPMVKNLLVVLIVLLGIGACIINMHLTSMHYSGTVTPEMDCRWMYSGR